MLKIKNAIPYLLVVFFNAFVDLGHKILIQDTLYQTTTANHYLVLSSILNALILLPYIMLFTPSGFISDRFAKVNVLRITALAVIPITLLITLCYYRGWFWLAFSLTIVLGLQSAINSPAKYGYIKEIFGKSMIAEANAYVQTIAIIAILAGTLVFTLLFTHFIDVHQVAGYALTKTEALKQFAPLGFLLVLLSSCEVICTFMLAKKPAADPDSTYHIKDYCRGRYLTSYLTQISKSRVIFISIIGLGLFWGVNQVLLASYGAYLKTYVGNASALYAQGSLAVGGIGILLGALYAGRVSKGFVETGIIPIGALGITLGLFLLANLTDKFSIICLFFAYGFFGGMLVVPLNALIQFNAKETNLGKVLAGNNFIQNIFMIGFLLMTTCASLLGAGSKFNFHVLFVLALIGTVVTLMLLPQSLVRYLMYFVVSKFYRVDVYGLDNLPSTGGVLLLGNHTSFLDWAIVQIASPRPVRFVMERSIYQKWYLHWLLKRLNMIPISAGASKASIETIREALNQGDVIALFPEGCLSRNGQLGKFHTGFERAVNDSNAVIVPFFLRGLWGTAASYATAKYKQITKVRQRKVSMTFGQVMPNTSTAAQVKQVVTQLSVKAWREYTNSLQSIQAEWLKRSKQMGSSTALIDSSGTKLSYNRLMATVFYLSQQLKPALKQLKNVGLLLPPSAGGAIANLSVMALGKAVVNLNYTSGESVLQYVVQQAELQVIITSKLFVKKLAAKGFALEGLLSNFHVYYLEDMLDVSCKKSIVRNQLLATVLPAWLLKLIYVKYSNTDHTAAILFSSGSEGKPKGVMLSHKNIMSNVKQVSSIFNVVDSDVVLSCLPLFHAFGLTVTTLMPLLEGTTLVCHPDPTDALRIGKLVYEHKVSVMCATSTFLGIYNRQKKLLPQMFESLRFVIAGAEKLSSNVADAFKQKFNKDIYEGYGATELSPVACSNLPDILNPDTYQLHIGMEKGSVGLPLPGTAIKIVDPVSLGTLPMGESGLILVSGPQLMLGYLNAPEKTDDVLCQLDGLTWYKTGDKGYIDSHGFLTVVDRYSRFAKVAGEMVSLSAVEGQVLAAIDERDLEVMAVAIADDKKGERIVLLHTSSLDKAHFNEQLRASSMENLMIPSSYIQLAELPKLGTGKKDYVTAKQLAMQEQ